MPLSTWLMEFRVTLPASDNHAENPDLRDSIEKCFTQDFQFANQTIPTGSGKNLFALMFSRPDGSDAVVRCYPDGLLTVDLSTFYAEGKQAAVDNTLVNKLEKALASQIGELKSVSHGLKYNQDLRALCLPPIHRGARFNTYYPTVDHLFIEYDFDATVYEADSPYQNIKIMHSKQFGNMLILDNDPNLAESDLPYTQAITGNGREKFEGATVLILGGGDGGILHELRKENPKFITMVDIDELVVNAARKHLRGICYDSLDQLKGDNYEVLIEDCVPILNKYIEEGRQFDYVINDLTAVPCTAEPVGDMWEFLRLILDLSMKVLSPTGKYFTQGNGSNVPGALKMYEEQLTRLAVPVDFSKETVFVPSYHEAWVFYEIWKKATS